MKRKDWLILFLLVCLYLLLLFINYKDIYYYQFNPDLITRYLQSQDIPHEVPGRLFLSDSDIHIASGYLYAKGENPISYNFQHPPLIKYFYGYSILFFNNPFFVQIGFGIGLLVLIYLVGFKIYNNRLIPIVAVLLLTIDPLFLNISSLALLDLGQAVLLILYILLFIFYSDDFVFSGVILGLFFASKFWGAALFFLIILTLYRYLYKKFILTKYLKHLAITAIIFAFIYIKSFIDSEGRFNLLFFQLKIFKYWLNHSISTTPFASLLLFISGYISSWWGERKFIRSNMWSLFWPISLLVNMIKIRGYNIRNKLSPNILVTFIPLSYLLYLGFQAAFIRYFILILPFSYLALSEWIYLKIFKK